MIVHIAQRYHARRHRQKARIYTRGVAFARGLAAYEPLIFAGDPLFWHGFAIGLRLVTGERRRAIAAAIAATIGSTTNKGAVA